VKQDFDITLISMSEHIGRIQFQSFYKISLQSRHSKDIIEQTANVLSSGKYNVH